MKNFIIYIDMFDSEIHVLNGATDQEYIEYTTDKFFDIDMPRKISSASCWTIYNGNGKPSFLIDFRIKVKKDPESMNTIGHESTHATFEIMKIVNIPYEYNVTDEFVCCLIGLIIQKMYEGLFY